jgi:hypothetical protein
MLTSYKSLRDKIASMERKYDIKYRIVFTLINKLIAEEDNERR